MFCCRTWPATCWLHWFACRSGAKVESESVPFIKWLARVWSEEVEMEALKQVRVVIKQLKATEEVWRKFGGHQWVCIHSFQRTVFIGKCWFQRSRRLSINHFMLHECEYTLVLKYGRDWWASAGARSFQQQRKRILVYSGLGLLKVVVPTDGRTGCLWKRSIHQGSFFGTPVATSNSAEVWGPVPTCRNLP